MIQHHLLLNIFKYFQFVLHTKQNRKKLLHLNIKKVAQSPTEQFCLIQVKAHNGALSQSG